MGYVLVNKTETEIGIGIEIGTGTDPLAEIFLPVVFLQELFREVLRGRCKT